MTTNKNERRLLMRCLCLAILLASASLVQARVYPMPPDDVDIVGEVQEVEVQPGETLLDIGRRYSVGYEEMRRANPGVDMWVPEEGSTVIVPTRHILPSGAREGIVLNVAELRMYYFPPAARGEDPVVETYSVSIGRMDWSTPLGESRVTQKLKNPAWYPPASVRKVAAAEGRELPRVVPPGPDNPIGPHALRLDIPGYFIHSTNEPWGVGMRVTHGCVRMYPEDIADLFDRIPVGTPVRIVNEPYKTGWYAGQLFMQAHPLLDEMREDMAGRRDYAYEHAVEAVADALGDSRHRVDYRRFKQALEQQLGVPVKISRNVQS